MSFSYLQQPYFQEEDDTRPTGGIHFELPKYLLDAPPTLAPGGGAEALHPAHAAQWFANSGFDHRAQYPQYTSYDSYSSDYTNVVQDTYHSLENLSEAFQPSPYPSLNSLSSYQQPQQPQWSLNASPPLDEPSPLTASGLPVYSQSGFDIVSLLARVQNRANPSIRLGPVDFTTSFIVVDVRRHDDPVVYCSPSFCTLTGYHESQVLGRNCRFLQAPPSATDQGRLPLAKGGPRLHTSPTAVRAIAKAVAGRKEGQVSVVNYRADGSAFVNLVSVVPLFGEHTDDPSPNAECVWYVGFQIDLTKQSEGIVERVREGTYYSGAVVAISQTQRGLLSNKSTANANQIKGADVPPPPPQARERRSAAVPAPRVSPVLARLLSNPKFLKSCGIMAPPRASTNPNSTTTIGLPPDPTSHALHSLLLEQLPDFVHVLSLKGAFLYVAPAVTRVLGWTPAELVGRALADLCFARDVVSVSRSLKEASLPVDGVRIQEGEGADPTEAKDRTAHIHAHVNANRSGSDASAIGGSGSASASASASGDGTPPALTPAEALRTVDLVFRARTKQGTWVWVECRGRLHVEPGKGRKAIVLVGRARGMAHVPPGTRFSGSEGLGELCVPEKEPANTSPYSQEQTSPYESPYAQQQKAQEDYFGQPSVFPQANTSFHTHRRSPSGSVSGLEFALQPQPPVAKRARIENTYTRTQHPSMLGSPSPSVSLSLGAPSISLSRSTTGGPLTPVFHGVLDPYGLLLSVGAGARALLGYDPLTLRGTRLGALVAPSRRLSDVGAVPEVERVLKEWRESGAYPAHTLSPYSYSHSHSPTNSSYAHAHSPTFTPSANYTAPTVAATREVRCTLQGRGGPVDVVVRIVAPLPERPGTLPPAVAPARLMYAVWLAGAGGSAPGPLRLASTSASAPSFARSHHHPHPHSAVEKGKGKTREGFAEEEEEEKKQDVFRRLDPKTGGSWQYELQQLRIENAKLEEEIAELERAEEMELEKERERERERVRAVEQRREQAQVTYHQQAIYGYERQQQQAPWGYALPPPTQTYNQLPMKRAWDRRDEV
ncbi:hypothetical protein K438DRAFT_1854850 [Mycena galopus ATCC 62051]|nr:hypothetical protein K438DRAFT_1854850 [Mycena galopus ATCC 62051]